MKFPELTGPHISRARVADARGFTLIEVLIAVAIISILTTVALPSYQSSTRKTHRSVAQVFLLEAANHQQQYLMGTRRYADSLEKMKLPVPSQVSQYYEITVKVGSGSRPEFLLTATPHGSQSADGPLSVDHTGKKLPEDKW